MVSLCPASTSKMPPLLAGSSIESNSVTLGTSSGGYATNSPAATMTPDPFASNVFAVTLDQNTIFAAPKMAGTLTGAGIYLVPGMRLTVVITQDGTGSRTAAWNAVYKLAGGALTLTTVAGKTDVVSFLCDGTSWLETSRSLAVG